MEQLVRTFEQYFEYLVLGVLLLSILTAAARAVFGTTWTDLRGFFFPSQLGDQYPGVRLTAYAGIVIGCLFLLGFSANVLGYWLLHPAHVHVISHTWDRLPEVRGRPGDKPDDKSPRPQPETARGSEMSSWLASGNENTSVDPAFFFRPFFRALEPHEVVNHRQDILVQMQWQVKESKSHESAFAGVLKLVRIVRGLVFLSLALFAASICVLIANLFRRGLAREALLKWKTGLALSVVFYLAAMGMYWQFESNIHHDVWAASVVMSEEEAKAKAGGGPPAGQTKAPGL